MIESSKTSVMSQMIEEFFIRSWWVILFVLGCYVCYEHGLKKKDNDFAKLQLHYFDLQKKKKFLLLQQEELSRQVNSQSDPAWVELVLMKGLGLTPEGQTKVLFTSQKETLERYSRTVK